MNEYLNKFEKQNLNKDFQLSTHSKHKSSPTKAAPKYSFQPPQKPAHHARPPPGSRKKEFRGYFLISELPKYKFEIYKF